MWSKKDKGSHEFVFHEQGDKDDAEAYRNDVVSLSEPLTERKVLKSSFYNDDSNDCRSDDNKEEEQGTEEGGRMLENVGMN